MRRHESGRPPAALRCALVGRGGNRFDLDNLVDPVLSVVGALPPLRRSVWATVDRARRSAQAKSGIFSLA